MLKKLLFGLFIAAGIITASGLVHAQSTVKDFTLSGSIDTSKTVKLNWDAPSGVDVKKYLIYRLAVTSQTPPTVITNVPPIDSTTSRSYIDHPTIQVGGSYVYQIAARTGTSMKTSNSILLTYQAPPISAFPLSATLVDSGVVKLNWSFPSGVPSTYSVIYRAAVNTSTGATDLTKLERIDSAGGMRYEFKDRPPVLTNGGSYAYEVAVGLSTGQRALSTLAYVYISPSKPATTFRLSGYLDSTKTTRLQWVAPTNVTVLKYYVYRSILSSSSAPFELGQAKVIDSTNGLTSMDTLTKKSVGSFAYEVLAKPSTGSLIPSNPITITIAAPPAVLYINLNATMSAPGKVLLTWENPSGLTPSKYYIYRAVYDPRIMAPVVLQLFDSTTGNQYVDIKLSNTMYGFTYQVRAKTGSTEIISNVVSLLTLDQITLTAYTDYDGKSVKLTWTTPASGKPKYYLIERNIVDNAGKTDSTKWVRVDSVSKNDYNDVPSSTAGTFLYRVTAYTLSGTIVRSNVCTLVWRPPVTVPFTLTGSVLTGGAVQLSWNDSYPFTPTKFYIFRATLSRTAMKVDSTTKFTLVDSTTNRSIKNTPPLNISTAFAYYVEARNGIQTARTNYFTVLINVVPVADKVVFVSSPVLDGRVGVLYSYQPKVVSSDTTAIFKWYLGSKPSGMTIDSLTGLVRWIPSLKGWFDASITVLSSKGGKAVQEFDIAVAGARGFVKGSVTDTLGNPIYAVVRLYKRDVISSFEYNTVTDSAGKFNFNSVDVGSYIAYAVALKGDFLPQWYYQKKTPDLATPIIVADSATATINFVLQSRAAAIPVFTLSGFVKDSSTGKAISGAVVIFARVEFMLNSAKNLGSSNDIIEDMQEVFSKTNGGGSISDALNGPSPYSFCAITDTMGKYSLRIPQGKYIGLSFAQGYQKLFFNGQTDLLSADILSLTKDTAGVGFLLKKLPTVALGSISGAITDTSGTVPVASRVIAFRDVPGKVESYFADADSTGMYTVGSLPPGDYYVLVIPLGYYAPSFYSNSGPTMKWKLATKLNVNGTSVVGIDVSVYGLVRTARGYTYIQGSVTTPKLNKLAKTSAVSGVNGSLVYATDASGGIAGYGISDASGSYTISGLSPQSYTVTSDRIGYDAPSSTTASPTYDASGDPQPDVASFNMTGTTTAVEELNSTVIPTTYSLSQNYPNPFNPSTRITFSLPQTEHVTLAIFNILGQKIAALVDGVTTAGSHTVVWNGVNEKGISAATGVYFYQLKSATYNSVKKMMLIK